MRRLTLALALILVAGSLRPALAADRCLGGNSAVPDAQALAAVRGAANRACPCAAFDGASPATDRRAYRNCTRAVVTDASDGTPLLGAYTLRRECVGTALRRFRAATCGYRAAAEIVACCEHDGHTGRNRASLRPVAKCADDARTTRDACFASSLLFDACSGDATNSCARKVVEATVDLPSAAQPATTPGSPGAPAVTNPKLLAQFGGPGFSLNNARYTRHRLAGPEVQPDAILVLVPGFEGGAGDFQILAENLLPKARAAGLTVELWAVDRRTNQLEDLAGDDVAEEFLDAQIALDWNYGGELGLPLHPLLAAGPNRRAQFYDPNADTAFMATWTNLVFSRDIDAVVTAARAAARNANVFVGGHSAGTGFAARYAATDFDLTGAGPPQPGYAKVRGLVLLEGPGGSTSSPNGAFTADSLDRMIAKFDGGLYGAVRDGAPRCVDGTTPCTIATEASDCAGQVPPKCTPTTLAYSIVAGLLNPRILSAGEVTAIQAQTDPNHGLNLLLVDQHGPSTSAVDLVPDLGTLSILPRATAWGGLGSFVDDDGLVAGFAPFVSTSLGGPGPVAGGITTWKDILHPPLDPALTPDNGPAPTTLPGKVWGVEAEPTRMDRFTRLFFTGRTNFVDAYYPNAGPSVTSITGVCTSGTCTVGRVGGACTTNAQCSQAIDLDSRALSIGRGRRDIENLTQAANIDVPVIAFGGSNGLVPVPGRMTPFAQSIAPCTAPSCDGTPRVVDAASPNPAFPTFGGPNGGFEVHISQGYAHLDVLAAEDGPGNAVLDPLLAFLQRNVQ